MKNFSKKVLVFTALFASVQNAGDLYAFGYGYGNQNLLTITNNTASQITIGIYKQEYKKNVKYVQEPLLYLVKSLEINSGESFKINKLDGQDLNYFLVYQIGSASFAQSIERKNVPNIVNITGKSAVTIDGPNGQLRALVR